MSDYWPVNSANSPQHYVRPNPFSEVWPHDTFPNTIANITQDPRISLDLPSHGLEPLEEYTPFIGL